MIIMIVALMSDVADKMYSDFMQMTVENFILN